MEFYHILGVGLFIFVIITYYILRRNLFAFVTVASVEVYTALVLRQIGGTIEGIFSVDLYVIKSDVYVNIGEVGVDWYVALSTTFILILVGLGGYARDRWR